MKILAIDDSKMICSMLKNVLSGAGHDVTTAGDGKQAMELARATIFDLIVTDVNMPEINGIDLAMILRTTDDYRNTPIIFLTTETKEELKSRGTEMEGTAWITKPFSPVTLLSLFDAVQKGS